MAAQTTELFEKMLITGILLSGMFKAEVFVIVLT